MKKINYIICRPGGNDTALVYKLNYSIEEKKQINDIIMAKHTNVEQVGFIDMDKTPELKMAGGEFCGNATRSAANCYLKGKQGNIQIIVNETDIIQAGVYKDGKSWCEIPLYYEKDAIVLKEPGIYIVKMKGMVTIVIKPEVAQKYLMDRKKLKQYGMDFINKYNLKDNDAVGVMFCEYKNSIIKINPIVWVRKIDTLFYETACGSGTTATCIVEAFESNMNQKMSILQPSGYTITAQVEIEKNVVKKAIISGVVTFEKEVYSIDI